MLERPLILALALLIDALIGDPDWLWRRAPHPVAIMGKGIDLLDRHINVAYQPDAIRRRNGGLAITVLLVGAGLIGWGFHALVAQMPHGLWLESLIVAVLLAQRSLVDHVYAVWKAFKIGGLVHARKAVAKVVGRDPESLDKPGICRAAIESCAENLSDGVIAPAFWYLIAGLPGLFTYKALNTADSMIGHLTPRYRAFGYWTATLDDVANYIPARLTGVLIAFAAFASHRTRARPGG